MDILELSKQRQDIAWKLIEEGGLFQLWEEIGGQIYIVGSLKSGLLIHRDIDIHVYTKKVSIEESFSVMAKLAERLHLTSVQYGDLLDTEEECLEWHSLFEDSQKESWKLDLIHIRKGSKYDGVVEEVTQAITDKLTPEIQETILRIKYDMPKDALIPGIEVYHAVFTGNIKTYEELIHWRRNNPLKNSLDWLP